MDTTLTNQEIFIKSLSDSLILLHHQIDILSERTNNFKDLWGWTTGIIGLFLALIGFLKFKENRISKEEIDRIKDHLIREVLDEISAEKAKVLSDYNHKMEHLTNVNASQGSTYDNFRNNLREEFDTLKNSVTKTGYHIFLNSQIVLSEYYRLNGTFQSYYETILSACGYSVVADDGESIGELLRKLLVKLNELISQEKISKSEIQERIKNILEKTSGLEFKVKDSNLKSKEAVLGIIRKFESDIKQI